MMKENSRQVWRAGEISVEDCVVGWIGYKNRRQIGRNMLSGAKQINNLLRQANKQTNKKEYKTNNDK